MDFENLQADVTKILPVHYTSGRGGCSINKVVLHHNAADLSIDGCYSVWCNREASAHYQVESSGRIGQLVNDWDTAWHAGNANPTSIGIEHADCSSNPWRISDACLESGAHLVAAICKYYGLGRPTWGVNVFGHSDFMATACPASLAVGGSQHDQYMKRAGEWYDAMCGGTQPSPAQPSAPATPSKSLGQVNVTYCAKVNGHWLSNVTNFNNVNDDGYAGNPCEGMSAIAVKVDKGSVRYRAHILGGDWLPWVTGFDVSDFNNGYAGDGSSVIDGVQVYYVTPDGYAYQQAYYRSQTVAREGWLDVVCDDADYAGLYGEGMDRLQICISDHSPF